MTKTLSGALPNLIAVLMTATSLCPALYAQGSGHSYRLTPPLRIAARPVEGAKSPTIKQADPFRPRDPRKKPTTLAIQGYCLVSLRDQRQWTLGSQQVQVILGGKVYLFAGPRARDIFLAAPELYLPALDGDCPVTFADTGERVSGNLEHGLVHGRRVYFFADQTYLQAFTEAPDKYIDADLVDGGFCVVSRLTEHRRVFGLPETVAIVDGRRYYFASAFHRRVFQQNPAAFVARPLKNPQAIAELEVPVLAESISIGALEFGKQDAALASADAPPLKQIKRPPSKRKGGRLGDEDEVDSLSEAIQNRGLAGYCPVTIRTQNTWRRGKSKFKFTFDGKVYFLSGPEELAAFQANPRQYVPVLSGDSVVALVNNYERVPGSVFQAFIYKDRMYLFANSDERQAFRDSPAQFEDADLAAQGFCMVSRIDEKKEVAGSAEFETLYFGKRYRFASEEYLKRFKSDSKKYADD